MNVINGTAGDDTLNGTSAADLIDGLEGNDTIFGDSGNDWLVGYLGNDIIDGGAGDDTIHGSDSAGSSAEADTMIGGDGNDVFYVDDSNDTVIEAAGGGMDRVVSGLSTYVMPAEVERFMSSSFSSLNITGNSSNNIIDLNSGVSDTGITNVARGGAGDDIIFGGGDGVSRLFGDGGDDLLQGALGNDTLTGGSGDDELYGDSGNDILNGGAGYDFMTGGWGDDVYIVDALDTVQEAPEEGYDTVKTSLATLILPFKVEALIYSGTGDFTGTGNELDNVITGGSGNDVIDGDLGNDTFVLTGGRADYQVTELEDGWITLRDVRIGSANVTDTVTSIEYFRFSDGALAVADLVNDAPSGTDLSRSIVEDSFRVLTLGDFGFSDPNGHGFSAIRISSLPFAGILQLNQVDLAVGDMVAAVDILAGKLVYTPDPDAYGDGYAFFDFQVRDNGGTLDGGLDLDSSPNRLSFNIVAVNDNPEIILDDTGLEPTTGFRYMAAGTSFAFSGGAIFAGLETGPTDGPTDLAFAENDAPLVLGPEAIVTDPDTEDFDGGILVVEFTAGATRDDRLLAPDEGGMIHYGADVIASVSGGADGFQPLTITFNALASREAVEWVVRSIRYANGSESPVAGPRTITFILTDGDGGTSDPVPVSVAVASIDDAPHAIDDTVATKERQVVAGNLFANNGAGMDHDPDGPPAFAVIGVNGAGAVGSPVVLASGAVVTVNADGSFSYDPGHAFDYMISAAKAVLTNGLNRSPAIDSFTYAVTGGDTATVTVTIAAIDGPGDQIWGKSGADSLTGTGDADVFILVDGGRDFASGAGGDDVFDLGATLDASDRISGGNGFDQVLLAGDYHNVPLVLSTFTLSQIERLVLGEGFSYDISMDDWPAAALEFEVDGRRLGTGNVLMFDGHFAPSRFTVLGGGANDSLTGGADDDLLSGGGGSNTLVGGAGNDTASYAAAAGPVTVGLGTGQATANGFGGIDGLVGIENVIGSGFDDLITGSMGNNFLDGGAGADRMKGDAGDDTYVVDNAGDVVTEAASAGTDSVESAITYTLTGNVENLTLVGTAANGTGNGLANLIIGNGQANILNGLAGADTMQGGGGNDTYVIDNAGDVVTELAGSGTDLAQSSVTYTLSATVENLILTGAGAINGTGNAGANILTGNSGANILTGGAAADTLFGKGGTDMLEGGTGGDEMQGGAGDDTYFVDNAFDDVIELGAAYGFDTVRSGIDYTLGAHVERLLLLGTAALDGTGNGLDNILLGNSAANQLDGGAGADEMRGFGGDDTYVVDNAGDQIFEINPADGMDTVESSVSFSLGSYMENLVLTGRAAIDGNGNTLVNNLTGNSAANILNGGAGADTMTGGTGNDTYFVDDLADVVVEAAGSGTDTVISGVDHVLSVAIENLTLAGSAVNGTGNGGANTINGNNAANSLSGGGAGDTLFGSFGNDTLDGGIGNDKLHGGASNDDLIGGAGFDSFYFDAPLNAVFNVDDMTDFTAAEDSIFLDRAIFTGIVADGTIGAAAFRAGSVALDASDRILYDGVTGQIRYDADGIGGGASILFATVTAGSALTAADFFAFT